MRRSPNKYDPSPNRQNEPWHREFLGSLTNPASFISTESVGFGRYRLAAADNDGDDEDPSGWCKLNFTSRSVDSKSSLWKFCVPGDASLGDKFSPGKSTSELISAKALKSEVILVTFPVCFANSHSSSLIRHLKLSMFSFIPQFSCPCGIWTAFEVKVTNDFSVGKPLFLCPSSSPGELGPLVDAELESPSLRRPAHAKHWIHLCTCT